MAHINEEFLKLQKNYLFADIAKKVNAYKTAHPDKKVISLGIGDVTQPLAPAVIEAMHKAVDDMATKEHFHGYGPEQGYLWLREAIVKNDYEARGIHLDPCEVFVNVEQRATLEHWRPIESGQHNGCDRPYLSCLHRL